MAYEREADVLAGAVRAAGEAIKRHFVEGAQVYTKADNSPVTDADLAANTILIERLRAAFPDDAILSEEVPPDATVHDAARCWIIDPLDGTAYFVRREPAFTVMVGLEVGGRPVVGAIYNPMTDEFYAAVHGEGATVMRGGETTPLRFPTVPYETARLGVTPGSLRTLTTGTPRWTDDPARFTLTGPNFGFRPEALDKTFDAYIGWIAEPERGRLPVGPLRDRPDYPRGGRRPHRCLWAAAPIPPRPGARPRRHRRRPRCRPPCGGAEPYRGG